MTNKKEKIKKKIASSVTEEDKVWNSIASKRDNKNARYLPHKVVYSAAEKRI